MNFNLKKQLFIIVFIFTSSLLYSQSPSSFGLGLFGEYNNVNNTSTNLFRSLGFNTNLKGSGYKFGGELFAPLTNSLGIITNLGYGTSTLTGNSKEFIGYGENNGKRIEVNTITDLKAKVTDLFCDLALEWRPIQPLGLNLLFGGTVNLINVSPQTLTVNLDENAKQNGIQFKNPINSAFPFANTNPYTNNVNISIFGGFNYKFKLNSNIAIIPYILYSSCISTVGTNFGKPNLIRGGLTLVYSFVKPAIDTTNHRPPVIDPKFPEIQFRFYTHPDPPLPPPDSLDPQCPYLFVKRTIDKDEAFSIKGRLEKIGITDIIITPQEDSNDISIIWYNIYIGPFSNRNKARDVRLKILDNLRDLQINPQIETNNCY